MRLYDLMSIDIDPEFMADVIRELYVFNTINSENHKISHAFEFAGQLQIGIETAVQGLFNEKNLFSIRNVWEIDEEDVIISLFEEF